MWSRFTKHRDDNNELSAFAWAAFSMSQIRSEPHSPQLEHGSVSLFGGSPLSSTTESVTIWGKAWGTPGVRMQDLSSASGKLPEENSEYIFKTFCVNLQLSLQFSRCWITGTDPHCHPGCSRKLFVRDPIAEEQERGDPCDSRGVAGSFPAEGSLVVVWFFNLSVQCGR